jgi:tRNA A-37 threonylcarbamoyl transferase component Bud32
VQGEPTSESLGYLVKEAAQRLSFTAALVALVYAVYQVLFFTVWSGGSSSAGHVIGIIVISLSLAVALGIRICPREFVAPVGITYEALVCAGLEVARYSALKTDDLASGVSWSVAVILFFPMLLPANPRVTLSGALLAASMAPLGYLIAGQLGARRLGDFSVLLSYWLPGYISAFLTWVPASVIQRLGQDVQRARRLGSYELVEKLGTGGMGEVWRARHKLLARPAAVKLIRPDMGDAERLTTRFKREAQATANLESPHTVRLYDFGVTREGVFYYVMELLKGIDLEKLVKRHGPLPPSRVVHILLQVCDSLGEAHSAQMVHRDIKPANVFVVKSGQQVDVVKVLDFGLVKLTGAEEEITREVRASTEGKVIGTPAYLAPELTIGGTVDGRTDLYALGCVAYFLISGQLVFSSISPIRMAVAHATEEPEPLSSLMPETPAELSEIIMRCLEKKPDRRPASAEKLAEQLRRTRLAEQWTVELRERWWLDNLPELCVTSALSQPPLKPATYLEPAE